MKNGTLLFALIVQVFSLFAQPAYAPFIHGVASGDPLTDKVILWTKVEPVDSAQPVSVNWRIATDNAFNTVVNSGSFTTDSSLDFSVKVDADGLQPGNWYYYQFETGGNKSITGRTKTAPAGTVNHVRFAVATCAKYSKGYFNSYARIAERTDIDAVIHLGDYIYESRDSGEVGRVMLPYARCSTLTMFRTRYAQYRTDPDLLEAHRNFPWISVWDDHEFGNDSWMYGSEHFPDSATFVGIKAASIKTYFEWMPIRPEPTRPGSIYRQLKYGDLIDLIMIDSRMEGRMQQLPFTDPAYHNQDRTMLGVEQFNWLISQLDNSTARWRIIGQQVMIAPAVFGNTPINNDQWDNYPAERAKIYQHLLDNQIGNFVVLTGDVHAALANNLPLTMADYDDETGAGSVGVEFITPAIASSKSDLSNFPFSIVKSFDPHIQYLEFDRNGYMILDVTPDKVQGDFYFVPTTDVPDPTEVLDASYYTLNGTRFLQKVGVSVPGLSVTQLSCEIKNNPAAEQLIVSCSDAINARHTYSIFDISGRLVKEASTDLNVPVQLNVSGWSKGMYFIKITAENRERFSGKFILE